MPRIAAQDEIAELKISDPISGETITLFYDVPTPEEQIAYSKALVRRKGNKIENTAAEANQKWGRKILRGFKFGNFAKRVDGKEVLFSSDDKSPGYDPNWKELVCAFAMDLVMFLAAHAFGGSRLALDIFGDEDGAEEDAGKNL